MRRAQGRLHYRQRQVDVHPRHIVFDELGQKTRGENVVAGTFRRALQEVRSFALEIFQEFLTDRERPDSLATVAAGTLQDRVQSAAIREYARVPGR